MQYSKPAEYMSQPEYRIVRKIERWLTQQGYFWFKIHGSALMRAGLPDIVVSVWGIFCGLEVKQPGEKATPAQGRVGEEITRGDGHWYVVHSLEEAQEAIRRVNEWTIRRA